MGAEGNTDGNGRRPVVYCVVPGDLVAVLDSLRRHFLDMPGVEVVVEQRGRDRRAPGDRRVVAQGVELEPDRRRIRNLGGRRVGERRAAFVEMEPLLLPRRVRRYAERLVFVERLEPSTEHLEDLDTARLVTRIQGGDTDAFSVLYLRYFDRVYSYLRVVFKDPHEAEDATQQTFVAVLERLPRYERRTQPFRAWLFTIVRNTAVNHLRSQNRVDVEDPAELNLRGDSTTMDEPRMDALSWISDREIVRFIERLPLAQRQVLVLRYMLDLDSREIARVLDRSYTDVRTLQHRAMSFLRARLAAVGRTSRSAREIDARGYRRQAPVLRMRRFALLP